MCGLGLALPLGHQVRCAPSQLSLEGRLFASAKPLQLGGRELRYGPVCCERNVKRFTKQLSDCTDEHQRNTLKLLLAEAETHLAELGRRPRAVGGKDKTLT